MLFATDSAMAAHHSGYARIVKQWKRGTPVAAAKTLYEGEVERCRRSRPPRFTPSEGDFGLVIRAVSFFESDYFAGWTRARRRNCDLPRSADLKGMIGGALIATLREDYAATARISPKARWWRSAKGRKPQLIYQPGPRASVESVAAGRDALYAAITDNVIGAVHVFTTDGKSWTDKKLALPGQRRGGYRFGQ